ncbi:MAG: DUF5698 domain-containing protein [Candidatus Paceibacterota bacterium]
MEFKFLIYFIAGICQDFLVTINWRFVAKEKIFPAAATSFIFTIVNLLVLYNIVNELNPEKSTLAIVIFALGISTGTILGMKTKISKKYKK